MGEREPKASGEGQLPDEESRSRLPKLNSSEEQGLDGLAQVKFFTPDSSWTWYASGFDGEDVFFGLVIGLDVELGYFKLSELKEVRGLSELPVEQDLFFNPKTLRELREHYARKGWAL